MGYFLVVFVGEDGYLVGVVLGDIVVFVVVIGGYLVGFFVDVGEDGVFEGFSGDDCYIVVYGVGYV